MPICSYNYTPLLPVNMLICSYNYAPLLPVNISRLYFSMRLQGACKNLGVWGRDYNDRGMVYITRHVKMAAYFLLLYMLLFLVVYQTDFSLSFAYCTMTQFFYNHSLQSQHVKTVLFWAQNLVLNQVPIIISSFTFFNHLLSYSSLCLWYLDYFVIIARTSMMSYLVMLLYAHVQFRVLHLMPCQ